MKLNNKEMKEFSENERYIIPSLKSAFLILSFLRQRARSANTTEISRALGIPKTTALRILRTMESCRVLQKKGMNYEEGSFIFDMADSARSRTEIGKRIHPYLVKLTRQTGETSHLCLPAHDKAVVVRECSTWQSLRSISTEGSPVDLNCSSAGKIILSEILKDNPKFINSLAMIKRTKKSIISRPALIKHLHKVSANDWALDDEEYNDGARCASVAVRTENGKLIGALGITGPSVRMTKPAIMHAIEKLKASAAEFSKSNSAYLEHFESLCKPATFTQF